MNKITKEDYKDLIGARLDQIGLGLYQIGLCFDKSISISQAHKLEIKNNKTGEVATWEDSNGKACICLSSLLDETITSYDINGRGDFTLNFSNNYTLVLYNDLTWDDTYQININGDHFLSGDNVTEN